MAAGKQGLGFRVRFHSLMSMQDKVQRGLVQVGKAVDQETMQEVLFMLGNEGTTETKTCCSASASMQQASLPCPGDAFPARVLHSSRHVAAAIPELQASHRSPASSWQSRDCFVALDETAWRATNDALSPHVQRRCVNALRTSSWLAWGHASRCPCCIRTHGLMPIRQRTLNPKP